METQLCNILQSLFETDGPRCYKTPTFYVMKLFSAHAGQMLLPVLPDDLDEHLDVIATVSEDETQMTVSLVNKHLYDAKEIALHFDQGWKVKDARIVTADDVRTYNSFDEPDRIVDKAFAVAEDCTFTAPAHSVIRICLEK